MSCADCDDCGADAPAPDVSGFACRHELHATVDTWSRSRAEFLEVCERLGLGAVVMTIVGSRPEVQYMTRSSIQGSDAEARAALVRVADSLEDHGLTVTRVKIEAAPWHHRVPVAAGALPLLPLPDGCYWESHVGLHLLPDQRGTALQIVNSVGGYLSLNELRPPDRQGHGRYSATYRSRVGTLATQDTAARMLRDMMRNRGLQVDTEVRNEFTWLDLAENPTMLGGPPSW